MVPWRAAEDGSVNQDVIDWYVRFSKGKPGAIVVEATGIRDIPSGPLLRISHDRFVAGLQQLVAAIKQAGDGVTKVFIQLIDFLAIRRRPDRAKFLTQYLKIDDRLRKAMNCNDDDAVRQSLAGLDDASLKLILSARDWESLTMGYREKVTDVEQPHIRDLPAILPGLFADAAARARAAGFDGIELHFAHAYTMASFLSGLNSRSDGYGKTLENRVRLPIEVFRAVRERAGDRIAVGCRMLADECIEGGNAPSDGAWLAAALASAGMDFISLSRGGKFEDAGQPKVGEAAYPYTGPSGYECMPQYLSDQKGPYGRNSDAARLIRKSIRAKGLATPIIAAGGVHGFYMAEQMLIDGVADIIATARQSLADPDWLLKIRLGRGTDVRVCEFSNYCEGLDQKHKQVTCKLWDRDALDTPGLALSNDRKRRLIAPDWSP